jgi:hypothetical protein
MRLVPNLDNTTECPNCTNGYLISAITESGRLFKRCPYCAEEIYESDPIPSEQIAVSKSTMNNILNTEGQVFIDVKEERKRDFVFEMREEISALSWNVHDSHTEVLVNNIQNILNRIIDYIEEN